VNTNLKKIAPEADGILKDGQTLRFRQMMMDRHQPEVVTTDNRPRFAVMDEAQKVAAHERQVASDKRLSEAWRNPPHQIVAQDLSVTPPEVLKPIAFGSGESVAALDAIQADHQRRYNERLERAWINPVNHGARGC
jgi:hypothetical protein